MLLRGRTLTQDMKSSNFNSWGGQLKFNFFLKEKRWQATLGQYRNKRSSTAEQLTFELIL